MKQTRLTFVIPTLNEEIFLPKLLNSLTIQTDHDFEVIVVDGNSHDKTVQLAEDFMNRLKNLKIIKCPHAGLPYQRNQGAKAASGNWLVFSDADNIFLPYSVERIKDYIKNSRINFFTTWLTPDTNVRSEVILSILGILMVEGSILIKRSFSPGPLTGIKSTLFKRIGGYNEQATWGEDMEFAQRVTKAGYNLDVIRETLYIWSMRRFRNEGKMKILQKFALASLYALITKRALTKMEGYEMGGHLYSSNTKKIKPSVLKTIDNRLRNLLKEMFE